MIFLISLNINIMPWPPLTVKQTFINIYENHADIQKQNKIRRKNKLVISLFEYIAVIKKKLSKLWKKDVFCGIGFKFMNWYVIISLLAVRLLLSLTDVSYNDIKIPSPQVSSLLQLYGPSVLRGEFRQS